MHSSTSSRSCSISECKHSSRALCICCNQYLCIEHLKDHSDKQNDSQLTSLTAEINILSDHFHHTSLVEPYFLKTLDQWRTDSHRTIDRFYETQRRHFEQFIQENRDKQRKEIDHLRLKILDLIREQNATQDDIQLIKDSIQLIEKDFNDLQHLQCNIRPLVIDFSRGWHSGSMRLLVRYQRFDSFPRLGLVDVTVHGNGRINKNQKKTCISMWTSSSLPL